MKLRRALTAQAQACSDLGSPFTARLLRTLIPVLERDSALSRQLKDWHGDIGPRGASLPLRLAGALHALVRLKAAPGLIAVYPPNEASDAALERALGDAIRDQASFIAEWIESPPQTNEVRRSAALIAVGNWLTARYQMPLILSELGASAGLNLMWDRFGLAIGGARFGPESPALTLTPDWSGPCPLDARPVIAGRRGVDLSPIDPRDAAGQLKLLSYLWPDQPDRIARTQSAISVASAEVDRGDAAQWLETRLSQAHPGKLHLIFHTVAWQYFPAKVKQQAEAAITAAGRRASDQAPLAWFAMEADENPHGAGLSLQLWPGGQKTALGRADFHGRWIEWRAPPP